MFGDMLGVHICKGVCEEDELDEDEREELIYSPTQAQPRGFNVSDLAGRESANESGS